MSEPRRFKIDEVELAINYVLDEMHEWRPKLFKRVMSGEISLLDGFRIGGVQFNFDDADDAGVMIERAEDGSLRVSPAGDTSVQGAGEIVAPGAAQTKKFATATGEDRAAVRKQS